MIGWRWHRLPELELTRYWPSASTTTCQVGDATRALLADMVQPGIRERSACSACSSCGWLWPPHDDGMTPQDHPAQPADLAATRLGGDARTSGRPNDLLHRQHRARSTGERFQPVYRQFRPTVGPSISWPVFQQEPQNGVRRSPRFSSTDVCVPGHRRLRRQAYGECGDALRTERSSPRWLQVYFSIGCRIRISLIILP